MWSNNFILFAMLQFRFRIFLQCLFLEIQCFQCRTILSTIFRAFPALRPGRAYWGFIKMVAAGAQADIAARRLMAALLLQRRSALAVLLRQKKL